MTLAIPLVRVWSAGRSAGRSLKTNQAASGAKNGPAARGTRMAAGPSHHSDGHVAMSPERQGHCPPSILIWIALSVS
jgi:hypothetical protein